MATDINSFDRLYLELLKQKCADWGLDVELNENHLEERAPQTWAEIDPEKRSRHFDLLYDLLQDHYGNLRHYAPNSTDYEHYEVKKTADSVIVQKVYRETVISETTYTVKDTIQQQRALERISQIMIESQELQMGKYGPCCPVCGLPPNESGFSWCGCSPESLMMNRSRKKEATAEQSCGVWVVNVCEADNY